MTELTPLLCVALVSITGTIRNVSCAIRTKRAAGRPTPAHPVLFAAGETITLATPVPEAQAAAAFTADTERRIITGLVLPYGEVGHATVNSQPMAIYAQAGSVRLPADLGRVKLVDQHQQPPQVVGYGVAAHETAQGLSMSFRVGTTPEGDRALLMASERLADAFSVELSQLQLDSPRPSDGASLVRDSYLTAVAQLGIPAFASARVASVVAALNTNPTGDTTMTAEQRARLAELLAMNARTAEQEQEFQTLTQLAVQEAATAQPDNQQQPAQQQQAAAGAQPQLVAQLAQLLAGSVTVPGQLGQPQLAGVPAGLVADQPGAGGGTVRPLTDLYAATARVLSGQSSPAAEAALADITVTANPYVAGADGYAGQLWAGLNYTRKFTPLLQSGELRNWKGNGWKWTTTPQVADYAGDKAAVTSNAPATTNVPWTAARLAGAHDIDRKFTDFGDTEFIASYYEALTMDYAIKSDAKARAFIIASATAGAAAGAVGLLRAAALVASRVNAATNDAGVDYVLCNDVDKLGLLTTSAANVPAFLADFIGIEPGKFIGTSAVAAGTVIAGNKNAGEFKELPGVPVRVENVVNLPNGGIDGGLFGYYATLLHMPTGIQSATWT